jgi:GPI mannosyltransferase 1 subunit M
MQSNSTLSAPSKLRFGHVVALSLLLRVALVVYAEYHDAHSILKYTDVDYRVFSDAARFTLHSTDENFARGLLGRKTSLGE